MNHSSIRLRAAILVAILPAIPACDSGANAALGCEHPTPIVIAGKSAGVDRCADGTAHAKIKVTCPSALSTLPSCQSSGSGSSCSTNADCKDAPHGYCRGLLPSGSCGCNYGCTTDADCGQGLTCLCGELIGQCVVAACTSDGDCPGTSCMSSVLDGCGPAVLACHTHQDACQNNADCGRGAICAPTEGGFGPWSCLFNECVIGRPLLVLGKSRLASLTHAGDWS